MDRAVAAAPRTGDDWVALSPGPLPVAEASAWVVLPSCGATVTFTGTARDHAEGRPGVHRLEYEAYEEPALARLGAIGTEIRGRWPAVGRVAMLHRIAIDELKRTVPIWKRESWDGGESWGLEAQHLTEVGRS
jgi:molybdopterin synthase catalytic subunit